MPTTPAKLSVDEHVELLTGYDEDDIERRFSSNYDDLRPLRRLRALVYADRKRQGDDDDAAFDAAMSLPVKVLDDYFAEDVEEAMPSEPDSEVGKGDSSAG